MKKNVMFMHNSDEWSTPQDLFNKLNDEFKFTLDPASTKDNAKCEKFFTVKEDGLNKNWEGEVVFLNPPYSKAAAWVEKAFYEGMKENTTVVLLLPARTDTKYFHNYILNHSEIRFIRGRLYFGECKNPAPFPSMLVIYRGPRV